MNDQTAYPLSWPAGWPRTKTPQRSRFGTYTNKPSIMKARTLLQAELDRLGARNPILSTNMELRLDGLPRSDRRPPTDTGAAIYFTLRGRKVVLACDKWSTVGDNIWAIAKHIEALRGMERWGVGNIEQAFTGYHALQEKTVPSCWETLGIAPGSSEADILSAYRSRAKQAHPDAGGTAEAFAALSQAKDIALASIK